MEYVIPVLISEKVGKFEHFTVLYHCKNIFFSEGSCKYDVRECSIPRLFGPKKAERSNARFCT